MNSEMAYSVWVMRNLKKIKFLSLTYWRSRLPLTVIQQMSEGSVQGFSDTRDTVKLSCRTCQMLAL